MADEASSYKALLQILVDVGEETLGVLHATIVHIETTIATLEEETHTRATLIRSTETTSLYRLDGQPRTLYLFLADQDYMRFSVILRRSPRKSEDALLYALLRAHFVVYPLAAEEDA